MYEEHDRAKGIESLNTKVCKRLFGIWRERERNTVYCTDAPSKYPMEDGWCHVWIFDHSSCHGTKADNAS